MINKLFEYKTNDFKPIIENSKIDIMNSKDTSYKKFLEISNGGYFFCNSLHLFGFDDINNFNSIKYVNELARLEYNLDKNIYFIGEDIFGNLFAFHETNVIFFNIETSEFEIIARDFDHFIEELFSDLDYYTGRIFIKHLNQEERYSLAYGKRLCPKYPFVLGGEYHMNNLVLKNSIENLSYCASIANQIKDLPEGSKIDIKLT